MKNKKIKKILSSAISLSIILSTLVFNVEGVNAASTTEAYSSPVVLMADDFGQAQSLGTETRLTDSGELVTTASGWDVTGGGYTEGKNSGGKFNLVDNSTSTAVTMTKKFEPVSEGILKWEFVGRVNLPDAVTEDANNQFDVILYGTDNTTVAKLAFSAGKITFTSKGGSNIDLGSCLESYRKVADGPVYVRGKRIAMTAYLNMNTDKVDVYINGDLKIKNQALTSGKTIARAAIQSKQETTSSMQIMKFALTKDYILNEGFDKSFNATWLTMGSSMYAGGVAYATIPAKAILEKDISCGNVGASEKVEFQYRFKPDTKVNAKIMDVQLPRDYSDNVLPSGYENGSSREIGSDYYVGTVTDSTAHGDVINLYTTTTQISNKLFSYTIPYSQLGSIGTELNLSFDIKYDYDNVNLTYKDTNNDLSNKLYGYTIHVSAGGKVIHDLRQTPRFRNSADWQNTSFSFKLDKSAIDAAVASVTDKDVEIAVKINDSANRKLTGNIYFDNIYLSPVKDSESVMSLNLTDAGKITLKGSGAATEVGEYVPNLWHNVRITYDRSNGTADVRINHLNTKTVAVNNKAPSNLIFENDAETGNIYVDGVTVKKVYGDPADYVPTPNPVKTDDGYYTQILSCALWTENGGRGWDAISGFDERTPVLGFYDEGKPEISDWEIKYMVEHGIDSQIFCWFHNSINNSGDAITAYKDAKYANMLDYSLMWTNTGSAYIAGEGNADNFKSIFRNTYVPFWIENYFKDPKYTKLDNKPVLYIFSASELLNYLGVYNGTNAEQVAAVNEEFAYLNNACIEAGFDGVKVFMYDPSSDALLNGDDSGLDVITGKFTYGYNERGADSLDVKWPTAAVKQKNIPILGVHHNSEAWNGKVDQYTTPAEFKELAKKLKNDILPTWDFSKLSNENKKLLILDNWNEYGEGHFLMPTKTFGFQYLDAFREVFAANAGGHTDVLPTNSQLERINVLYDQSRVRRDGSDVASANEKRNIVELWDFTKAGTATYVKANEYDLGNGVKLLKGHVDGGITVTEGVGIQGVTTNGHDYIAITGLNIDLATAGIDSVYIRSNENVDSSVVTIRTTTIGNNDWSAAVTFAADWNPNVMTERSVYMADHAEWKGTLTGILVRVPVTKGDSFTVEAIGLMKNNMFTLGDELVANGSFEKGTTGYSYTGVTAETSSFDFNRGASSLKVTGNGTVKTPVSGVTSKGTYSFEAYAKLPFEATSDGNLKAYLTYKVNGEDKTSNVLTLSKFQNKGYAKLNGEFDITEPLTITDAMLCIENGGNGVYYLDDVSLRKLDTEHTQADNISNNVHNGVLLTFAEKIDITKASAVCGSTVLTLSKPSDNTVLVSLPPQSSGKDVAVVSGITTIAGENVGVISVDIVNNIEESRKAYFTNYDNATLRKEVTQSEFASLRGETVTVITNFVNASTAKMTGNFISAFYNGNELVGVTFTPFTANANTTEVVKSSFKVPSGFTEYKEFVWSTELKPILKGGE